MTLPAYVWHPVRDPDYCRPHGRGIFLVTADEDHVVRLCRLCGYPLDAPEPRCLALIADGSRRCFAPGRDDGLCRSHWRLAA